MLVCWYVGVLVFWWFGISCMKFEGGDDSATSDLQSQRQQCDNVRIVSWYIGKLVCW